MPYEKILKPLKKLFSNTKLVDEVVIIDATDVAEDVLPYSENNEVTPDNINGYLDYDAHRRLSYILSGLGLSIGENPYVNTSNITEESIEIVKQGSIDVRSLMYAQIYEHYRAANHFLRLLPISDNNNTMNIVVLREITLSREAFLIYTRKCLDYVCAQVTNDIEFAVNQYYGCFNNSLGLSERQTNRALYIQYYQVLKQFVDLYNREMDELDNGAFREDDEFRTHNCNKLLDAWWLIGVWYWISVGYNRIRLSKRLDSAKKRIITNMFQFNDRNDTDKFSTIMSTPLHQLLPTYWKLKDRGVYCSVYFEIIKMYTHKDSPIAKLLSSTSVN